MKKYVMTAYGKKFNIQIEKQADGKTSVSVNDFSTVVPNGMYHDEQEFILKKIGGLLLSDYRKVKIAEVE